MYGHADDSLIYFSIIIRGYVVVDMGAHEISHDDLVACHWALPHAPIYRKYLSPHIQIYIHSPFWPFLQPINTLNLY